MKQLAGNSGQAVSGRWSVQEKKEGGDALKAPLMAK